MKLSSQHPWMVRFFAWIMERFPPPNWLLIGVLFVTGLVLGRAWAGHEAIELHPADFGGLVAAISFFLMLRIFDEHKDYKIDCINHPQRVLQRGLITLAQLKLVGVFAIGFQATWSVYVDRGLGPVTYLWLVVIGWSLLMAQEFFVGEWLKRRVVLYGFSHMLVMPMAMLWWVQMGHGTEWFPPKALILAAMSFCAGASFEIARKTWGPEEERETVDSYARVFGIGRAPFIIVGLVLVSVVLCAFVLLGVGVEPLWPWLAGLGVLVVAPVVALVKFRCHPSAAGRKANEAAVGLFLLLAYGLVIAAVLVDRGLVR